MDKKRQAAIAGVLYYLKQEEEQCPREPDVIVTCPTPWALNGRQTIMRTRAFMQRGVFRR